MNGCVYRTADNKCEFWSDNGEGIVSYCDFANCENKKPSRAERIRSMTDEELAELMCHYVSNGTVNCIFCAAAEFCHMGHNGWLDWLKQETEE